MYNYEHKININKKCLTSAYIPQKVISLYIFPAICGCLAFKLTADNQSYAYVSCVYQIADASVDDVTSQ